MSLVLDTGPVLALLDAGDPMHHACVAMTQRTQERLVLVDATLVEIDYWVRKKLGLPVWQAFVEDIAKGAYRVEHLRSDDLQRMAELEAKYADLSLGMVDAAVLTVCERLREPKVATLDQRHFRVVQLKHCKSLTLLPG